MLKIEYEDHRVDHQKRLREDPHICHQEEHHLADHQNFNWRILAFWTL